MAFKVVLVALVLVALVAAAAGTGESGHAVPLRRAEQSLGWMNDMRGGMQPSITATAHRRTMIGEKKESKFVAPVPSFRLPPLPPNAEKESKSLAPVPSFRIPPLPPNAA